MENQIFENENAIENSNNARKPNWHLAYGKVVGKNGELHAKQSQLQKGILWTRPREREKPVAGMLYASVGHM